MKSLSSGAGRDPQALAIEGLLAEMEEEGMGTVKYTIAPRSVTLQFDGLQVEGWTMDIALVRLAGVMIDDKKYTMRLLRELNKPKRSRQFA